MRVLGSLILAFTLAAAIGIAANAAGVRGQQAGTIVISCSGCPQQSGGPVLLGISVRSGQASILVGPCPRESVNTCPAPYTPAYSRDGSRLAMIDRQTAVAVSGGRGRGYTILSATRGSTAGHERNFAGVSWSPTGARIVTAALDGTLDEVSPSTSVFTVDPNSGAMRRIRASTSATGNFVNPAWSPDGSLILTGSSRERLYTMRPNGSGLRRVRPSGTSGRYPAWSPDGHRIAALNIQGQIWWIDAAGRHLHVVTTDPDLDWNAGLAWSPDGRWIAYARQTTFTNGPYENPGHALMLAAADGSEVRRLVVPALPANVYSEIYGIAWGR